MLALQQRADRAERRERALDARYANYFTEVCSGSEAGSYLKFIDFEYHSTLPLSR